MIMAGLPGTGKSTLARAVAKRIGAIVLDKDVIRLAMFPGAVEYTTEQDEVVVTAMLAAAEYLLHHDPARVVILDGRPFSRDSQLKRVMDFAEKIPTAWRVIECICKEDTAKARLKTDTSHTAANRNWNLYQSVKSRYEPKPQPKLVVDTDEDVSSCTDVVLTYLEG